jgi:hypothetical protein
MNSFSKPKQLVKIFVNGEELYSLKTFSRDTVFINATTKITSRAKENSGENIHLKYY